LLPCPFHANFIPSPYLRKRLQQIWKPARTDGLESPSLEKKPTDRCCEVLAEKWLPPRHDRAKSSGRKHAAIISRVWKPPVRPGQSQLMVLAITTRSYPPAPRQMPFRISAAKAYEPRHVRYERGHRSGALALEAIRELQAPVQNGWFSVDFRRRVGSESSANLIEEEADAADAC